MCSPEVTPETSLETFEQLARGSGVESTTRLVSTAADPFRGRMAQLATRLTRARFPTIELYAPLYLSNACTNTCTYCGFRYDNPIERTTLEPERIRAEADALARTGIRSVLLVTGEAPAVFGVDQVLAATEIARARFERVAIEIFPMSVAEYRRVRDAGASSLSLYQETYDRVRYREVHRAGRKRNYLWRLGAPHRAADAGFTEIGLGVLLGLGDWRRDTVWLARHAEALLGDHPDLDVTFSFPRLRSANGGPIDEAKDSVNEVFDDELEHMMCALRIAFPDSGATLSTRESRTLRDRLGPALATKMSAGSSTRPGGYASDSRSLEQFGIADERSPRDLRDMLRGAGIGEV